MEISLFWSSKLSAMIVAYNHQVADGRMGFEIQAHRQMEGFGLSDSGKGIFMLASPYRIL